MNFSEKLQILRRSKGYTQEDTHIMTLMLAENKKRSVKRIPI